MKKILFAATFAIFASTQAFAIFGIGVHYVMNTGSLDGNEGKISLPPSEDLAIQDIIGNEKIIVTQKSASGLQGIGFKAWIDFLPFVDIEGTLNIAATQYKTSLIIPKLVETEGIPEIKKDTINLSYSPDPPYNVIPGGSVDPLYGIVNGDLSVTYPFDFKILRPYIGAGFSYFASIPIVNASFAEKMINKELLDALIDSENPDNADAAKAIKDRLIKKLKGESYTTGMGGHIIAGLRIKPPIIPLAIYANGKYYIGGNTNSQFSQGFVLEAGGGFAL